MSQIDVILPTYNHSNFVGRAIEYIMAQDFSDFNLIIINDGSTDSTRDVLDKYKDRRITVIDNDQNKGLPCALNIGHEFGKSPFCTWVSSDNISYKNHLKECYKCIVDGDYDFVQGKYIVKDGSHIYYKDIRTVHDNWGFSNLCPSFLYKRHVWELYRYDEFLPCVEDLKFYLQAFLHPFKFGYVEDYLVEYYVQPNSMSAKVHRNMEEHNEKLKIVYEQVVRPYLDKREKK